MNVTKLNNKAQYVRNPIYIFYALAAVLLFLITTIFANRPTIGGLEEAIFNVIYRLPSLLTPPFIAITMLGSIVTALLIALVFVFLKRFDIALRIAAAALLARLLVELLKNWVERGRPETFFPEVSQRITANGFGFPSGHAAVSAAAGLTLALYAPRQYRRWIIWGFVLVGCSRIFLGVHLPLDIIGGWAVGLFSYSLTSLALGSKFTPINPKTLAKKLAAAGMTDLKLKPASVDARGSVPFFGEFKRGKVFVKVFNQDNNAADWLFKLLRRLQYRRLEDEVPSLTPKRAVEHEAYLTMLARQSAKVRVPEVVGMYKVGNNSYAMATMRLDATGLDKLEGTKITDTMLDETWKQILKLHANNIIHKDLRCANVMVENQTKLPWLIDFGFSECAVSQKSFYKDNVEFIASSATKIGAKRAVAAAFRALNTQGLGEALPYMQYAALSGATTSSLKNKPGLLEEIRREMSSAADISPSTKASLRRTSIQHRK